MSMGEDPTPHLGAPRPDRYVSRGVLGKGGLGIVYRVFDSEMQREVALKTLLNPAPEDLLLLKREFRSLANLVHPNLVRLYELEVSDSSAFFTMELVEGQHIIDRLCPVRGAPASNARAVRVAFRQLAEALAAMHEIGLLHRDVKPGNVLVDGNDRVVLLDFGLVVGMRRELSLQSQNQLAGTLAYMAPEQAWGQSVSEAADWYSVGIMLYEALAGMRPFEVPSLGSLLDRKNQVPDAPDGPAALADPDLADLAVALLRFDVDERPTGGEVIDRLTNWRPAQLTIPVRHGAGKAAPVAADEDGAKLRPLDPFVNRIEERTRLRTAFDHTLSGQLAVVWVDGPSGSGKSALVERVLLELERDTDALVLRSRCHPHATMRYEALDGCVDDLGRFMVGLSSAEREALRPQGVPALTRVFPMLRRVDFAALAHEADPADSDPAELRRMGFGALHDLIARTATRRPVVMWIDDLQWGDADSAPFLRDLFTAHDAPPILLVLSARADDAGRGALLEALEGARCVGYEEIVRLEPMSEEDVVDLVAMALGDDADREHACSLAAQAEGSPLFALELARYARAHGAPTERVRLRDVLRERLHPLTWETRDILEWVAVAGRPLETQMVLQLAGEGAAGRPSIYELCARGWLRAIPGSDGADRVDTSHARFREVVLHEIEEADRARRHRALADGLAAREAPNADAVYQHYRAANAPEAVDWAHRAAEEAERRLAFDRAAALYGDAFSLAGERDSEWPLLERQGVALTNAGRSARAARVFDRAASCAARARAPEIEPVRLRGRAAEQHFYAGELEAGTGLLRSVLPLVGVRVPADARAARRRALSCRARFLLRESLGRRPERLGTMQTAALDPVQAVRMDLVHRASRGLTMLDPALGDALAAEHLLDAMRAGETSRLVRALGLEAGIEANLGGAWFRGRAMRLLDRVDALAESSGDAYDRAWAIFSRSNVAWFNGEWRECAERGREAVDWLRARCIGIQWEKTSNDVFTLSAQAQMGELQALRQRIPELIEDARRRGDAYAVLACRSGDAAFVALADDAPDRAVAEVAEAGTPYEGGSVTSLHYYYIYPAAQIEIYRGNPGRGLDMLERIWPALQEAGFLSLDCIGNGMRQLRGRAALATAMLLPASEREPLLRIADECARAVGRSTLRHNPGQAAILRAGIHATRGNAEACRRALEQAVDALDAADMALYAAAARLRLGRLVDGDEGAVHQAAAHAAFEREGVRDVDAFAHLLVPGEPARILVG